MTYAQVKPYVVTRAYYCTSAQGRRYCSLHLLTSDNCS